MMRRSKDVSRRLLGIFALAMLFLATSLAAQPPAGYYDPVDATNSATLRQSLHGVIDDHLWHPYTDTTTDTWDILNLADEDPNNMNNIVDLYKNASYAKIPGGVGAYNREHSWPKSYGFPDLVDFNYPYTDCHHLFAADASYNGSRSNKPFRECDAGCTELTTDFTDGRGGGSGVYPGNSNWTSGSFTQGTWETWDGRKGDVARAMFYMDLRYEGGNHGITGAMEPDLILTDNEALIDSGNTGSNEAVAYMGMLSVLLQWHQQDPPDSREVWRNEVVFTFQGNRNPFIDHPEWAECLFNNVCSTDTDPPAAPAGLVATALNGGVELSWLANTEGDLAGYHVYRATTSGGPYTRVTPVITANTTFIDGGLTNGTPYFYVVTAVDTSSNESPNSGQVSATPDGSIPDATPPAAPTGLAATSGDGQIDLTWNANGEADLAGYNLYRATVSGGPYTQLNGPLLAGTTFNDSGLTNGTEYFYVVTAVDTSANESTASAEASALPQVPNAVGVILSEVLYDVSSGDDGFEWVELYNGGAATLDLSTFCLGNGGTTYTTSLVQLSGTVASGATFVVGGPTASATNANPVFDQVFNFNPDFQNSGTTGDGVALFNVPCAQVNTATVPVDAVVYGPNNNSGLLDETGSANAPEVGDAGPGSSIERVDLAGNWQIQSNPTPNATNFTPPPTNTAPVVTITAPSNGASFADGTSIAFSGTATDAEDGNLTASLTWTSDLDGTIGSGGSFNAVLTPGTHTVTAAVTDSGGLPGSDAIFVTVTPPTSSGGDLLLSEVFYDASGTDDGLEWIELYNNDTVAIDLAGFSVGSGGVNYTGNLIQLAGVIQPGETFVFGGPTSNATNYNPLFDGTVNFNPDLENSGTAGDGIALYNVPAAQVTGSTVPIDAVVYGPNNNNGLIDETGNANAPEVGDAPSGSSIERIDVTGSWQIQGAPTPNASPLNAPVNTAPVVTITAPANGSTFNQGASVAFTGTATDAEEGDLSASLSWSSNLDGSIGSGASFSTAALSVGTHTITASVTDAGGLNGADAITVTIDPVSGPTTVTFTAVAAEDGWVRESNENSNVGSTTNSSNTGTGALRAGDDRRDRQYRSVVSFDTSALPDGAVITGVTLRLRRGTVNGTNPFTTHGACWVDVHNGGLNGSTALESGDFEAAATVAKSATLSNAANNGDWSEATLDASGLAAVSKTGTTQLRFYFDLDDNDDRGNDYIGYYSADHGTAANHPELVVTYQ
jgi:endonuclease I